MHSSRHLDGNSPYDGPLSAIRSHVEDIATWLAMWAARAGARRC